ncbi:MAG: CMP/dCMP kinase [Clostridiales bacterium]|jgi:cytidylate kinase|nr:CMP/dCMP kinase [Clostridiales bacterium]MDK2932642.1 CMP/dCMP kinase [Clostridiales bacterium]
MSTTNIAIDGPAGAGKSTMAKIIADKLGYIYIDTGAMYRAVALYAIQRNIDTNDVEKIRSILDHIDIDIKYDEDGQVILLNGQDVTKEIRTPEVSVGASNVAAIPEVRLKLVELQRKLATENNVIMDGRDIGTYVLPNANIKIFLTASVEERARRRYEEMIAKQYSCNYEDIKKEIEYRDRNDSSRAFAPLTIADDAVVIDTSNNKLEQSVEMILQVIKERLS